MLLWANLCSHAESNKWVLHDINESLKLALPDAAAITYSNILLTKIWILIPNTICMKHNCLVVLLCVNVIYPVKVQNYIFRAI